MPKTTSTQSFPSSHLREIAAAPRSPWWNAFGADRINSGILRSEGFLQAAGRSATSWDHAAYSLFEEMEQQDAHLYSILQTRRNGLLARERRIRPASMSESDRRAADWLDGALSTLPTFECALGHLLDSLAKGMAVVEIVWGYDAQGRIVPLELKPRAAGRFDLGPDGALYLNDSDLFNLAAATTEQTGIDGDTNRSRGPGFSTSSFPLHPSSVPLGRRLPDRKFLVMLFNPTDERPYGRGLCERVYWYWWFKKTNLKFWVLHNEKFGAPTVVAKHPAGLSEPERERLLEIISNLHVDAGITIPEDIALDLLDSNRRGSAETYRELANWCNEEMSRAVLGQTLTVGEGARSGSFALARVHESVRFDYIRADACLVMSALNSQLVRWMIDFNFGPNHPAPRWEIDLNPDIDAELEMKIDRQLVQMGVPLPLSHFYSKYRRPAAAEGERQLRYDDSNLFQYHLQFGILTINEVRSSLGLSPVAWGDRPTSPVAAQRSHSAPEDATGDAPTDLSELELKKEAREEK